MPHIIVKMFPGRSEEIKKDMADKITKAVMQSVGVGENTVSVSIIETEKRNWLQEVYIPDIQEKEKDLYKKPGYKPEDL
jgi:4-oxalocrotonate tautomerase